MPVCRGRSEIRELIEAMILFRKTTKEIIMI